MNPYKSRLMFRATIVLCLIGIVAIGGTVSGIVTILQDVIQKKPLPDIHDWSYIFFLVAADIALVAGVVILLRRRSR